MSTPDLIVVGFQKGCGQMDLASACVLRPLNRLVLDFETEGWQDEQAEVRGILDWRCQRGLSAREGVKAGNINGMP